MTYNRQPLGRAQRIIPKRGDLLIVGTERFTFIAPRSGADEPPTTDTARVLRVHPQPRRDGRVPGGRSRPSVRPTGRSVTFNWPTPRLSRLSALLAAHDGAWYIHTLSKKPLGRNRKAVTTYARVEDGDELLIGPLVVRIEIRGGSAEKAALPTGLPIRRSNIRRPPALSKAGPQSSGDGLRRIDRRRNRGHRTRRRTRTWPRCIAGAQQLEKLVEEPEPARGRAEDRAGRLARAQRDKLRRFWLDTPETTAARSLRTAGEVRRGVRDPRPRHPRRPDGPELLRELYRLYEAAGLFDFCYRPLRHIEKLAEARGTPDPWVLETLARLCERLSVEQPAMADRAIAYWHKLEAATGSELPPSAGRRDGPARTPRGRLRRVRRRGHLIR